MEFVNINESNLTDSEIDIINNKVRGILVKDDKVLVANYGGIILFPGGKVDKGENLEEALVREIQEELDTTIKVERFLTTVDWDYPKFHLTMHCYLCTVAEGDLTLREHEAAKWLTMEDIDSVNWLPADVLVVNALKEQC